MSEAKRTENGLRVGATANADLSSRTSASPIPPRCLKRKDAAPYMGLSLRKFDEVKHLFRVVINGVVRYDRELMDLHISLARAA